jgi:hypothetical protein
MSTAGVPFAIQHQALAFILPRWTESHKHRISN